MNLLLTQRILPNGKSHFVNFSIKSRTFLTSIALLMLLSFQTFAQDDWTLLKEENGVKVYYQIAECDDKPDLVNPLEMDMSILGHETFQLKLVNANTESKSITFSKLTKTDDSDELETMTISSGTTLLETCTVAPKMTLTMIKDDHLPISVIDFLDAFILTINN